MENAAANIKKAIQLIEEADSLVQASLKDCYDIYQDICSLIEKITDQADVEGIKIEE